MLTQEIFMEIHVLHRQGHGIKAIARKLGISKNTVRKYLHPPMEYPTYSQRPTRPCKLDPYKAYLLKRIEAAKLRWTPSGPERDKRLNYRSDISEQYFFMLQTNLSCNTGWAIYD